MTAATRAPDLAEAARFLALLDESAERFTFQTFDDDKARKDRALARCPSGQLSQHAAALAGLNASGAGVFVTVNETDGTGRKARNIVRVRAVWQEDDGDGKELPLEPHIVVESSPGKHHRYLLVDGLTFEQHAQVMATLVHAYGSDPNAATLERVLRLPGFDHRKGTPHRVRIVRETCARPYTAAEILAAFPPVAVTNKPPLRASQHADAAKLADLRAALECIPADDRDVWQRMGHALAGLGEPGRALWLDWSRRSDKFDDADAARVWASLQPTRTGCNAVFAEAQRHGWQNPYKGKRAESVSLVAKVNVSDVTDVQRSNGAGSSVTAGVTSPASDVTADEPRELPGTVGDTDAESVPLDKRPCYRVFDDWTRIREHGPGKLGPGVWYFDAKPGTDTKPTELRAGWICSPLHIEAVTRDPRGNNYGRLLRFRNTNDAWREWAMPMALLAARGDELRRELLGMGVHIDPGYHAHLTRYLQALTPSRNVLCVAQTGWSGAEFVLPDGVIGPNPEGVALQTGERVQDEFTCAGTLQEWQSGIAARAVGNPVLALALSAAFAGPLLAKVSAEGGGLHFMGDSSAGKTSAIEAACSVWGGPGYKRSWRATANGMEGAAAMFNDCLLTLDEISECDPREVGAIVYALGNGAGKQRAARTGAARGVVRWRCFVLSSGERTIETAMAEGGHRAKAGQGVRLLNVPVARAFGAWDTLHGLANGAAFSDAIKRAAATHYGHAGRAFLQRLTADSTDLRAAWEAIKARPEFTPADGEGQDRRAAARFALVAMAGEMATHYGLTGWPEGEATRAAAEAFHSWRSYRGKGNDERRQVCDLVAAFIAKHGDARFSCAVHEATAPIRDRAGWWRDTADGRVYLFNAAAMREALPGFDLKRALDLLQEVGALPPPNARGERALAQRIGGRVARLYPIRADALERAV